MSLVTPGSLFSVAALFERTHISTDSIPQVQQPFPQSSITVPSSLFTGDRADRSFSLFLWKRRITLPQNQQPVWWNQAFKTKLFFTLAQENQPDLEKYCVKLIPDIDCNALNPENNQTTLMVCAKKGWSAAVEELLQRNANPTTKDKEGNSAFSLLQSPSSSLLTYLTANYLTKERIASKDAATIELLQNRNVFTHYIHWLLTKEKGDEIGAIVTLFESTTRVFPWIFSSYPYAPSWWTIDEFDPTLAACFRFKQLTRAYPNWKPQTTLQRTLQQLEQMDTMLERRDISLGDISALLRRHLSAAEENWLKEQIRLSDGTIAKKIAAELSKNQSLLASVTAVIQSVITTEEVSYENAQHLIGVKFSNSDAQTFLTRLSTSQDAKLQAILNLYTTITSNWQASEKSNPTPEVILPIALYCDCLFQNMNLNKKVKKTILFSPLTHLRRGIAIIDTGIAIFPRKKFSICLGKGANKTAEAVTVVHIKHMKNGTTTSTSLAYDVSFEVRLISNDPAAVDQMKHDFSIAQLFENQPGFLKCHAIFQYGKKDSPKISAFYDRCQGPINKVIFRSRQQLQIIRDVLLAISKLHGANCFHFDVKPNNILYILDASGNAYAFLIDFNLSGSTFPTISFPGFYGTITYTAPELLANSQTTFSGDLEALENFAVGTTLYLMTHPETKTAPWETDVLRCYHKKCSRETALQTMNSELAAYHHRRESAMQKVRNNESLTTAEIGEYIISRFLLADPKKRWTARKALAALDQFISFL